MDLPEKIVKAIEKELKKNTTDFYNYGWQDKIIKAAEGHTARVKKLIERINKELKTLATIVTLFSPATRGCLPEKADYTVDYFDIYKDALLSQSLLIHARETICDEKCTEEIFEAVEAMLYKVFKIKYYPEYDGRGRYV